MPWCSSSTLVTTATSLASLRKEPTHSSASTTSRPAILGVAQAGHTLQAKRGSWSSVTSPTYSYRWCWTSGSTCQKTLANGASKTSYVPSAADIGKRILLLVTATDEVGSTTAASDPTAPVAPDPPDNDSKPTFSGTAREGSTLTKTSNGAWSHPKPTSYSSQ